MLNMDKVVSLAETLLYWTTERGDLIRFMLISGRLRDVPNEVKTSTRWLIHLIHLHWPNEPPKVKSSK